MITATLKTASPDSPTSASSLPAMPVEVLEFPVSDTTAILWLQEGTSFRHLAVVRDRLTLDALRKAVDSSLLEASERLTDPADILLAGRPGMAHGNARQIVCTAVDREAYSAYVLNGGKNGRKALPLLDVPRVFVSESEASLHIGCVNHEVGQRLSVARRAGKIEANVRGATFRYVEDLDVGD